MRTSSRTSRADRITRWPVCIMLLTSLYTCASQAQIVTRSDKVIFELAQPIDTPSNFNWMFSGVRREHGAHQAMYEPLFLFNYKTGALEPWLAKSIAANKDQNVWTLKLRDDVKWSDSKVSALQPFNAEDVEFTANLILKAGFAPTASEAVAFRAQVKPDGIKRVDASTVEFTLMAPNPRFALETFGATMFSSLLILPKHIWLNKDPNTYTFYNIDSAKGALAPVGTGPYVLKEIDGKHTLWVRNKDWWGAVEIPDPDHPGKKKPVFRSLPAPLALQWDVVDNINDSKTKLKNSDLDLGRTYSLDDFNEVKDSKDAKIVGWDSSSPRAWNDPCARQLDIYTPEKKLDESPNVWSNPELRKALSLLIDRAALAHDGYKDATVPSTTMFAEYPPMQPFIDAVAKAGYGLALKSDPTKADGLLKANGYVMAADHYYKKAGVTLGAVLKVDASVASDVDAANALSAQLNAAGVKIDVKTIPHDTFWGNTIPRGDYDIVYSWLSCGSVAEPFTSMNRYTSRDKPEQQFRAVAFRNTGRWETTAAASYSNEVIELGKKPLGDPGIPALVAHAYQYLDKETPFIPLVQSPTIIPFNTKYWTGWPVKGSDTVPMTRWEGTVRIIHELVKAGAPPP